MGRACRIRRAVEARVLVFVDSTHGPVADEAHQPVLVQLCGRKVFRVAPLPGLTHPCSKYMEGNPPQQYPMLLESWRGPYPKELPEDAASYELEATDPEAEVYE